MTEPTQIERCPHCGKPAESNGTFQCRCTGLPTQQQIEAAKKALYQTQINIADLNERDVEEAIKAALTAAAGVEITEQQFLSGKEFIAGVEAATIERCAQVVENIGPHKDTYAEIVRAIRALKAKP